MAHSVLIRKPGLVALMIAAAALWMSTAAVSVGTAQGQSPCADDVQKFCKDVQPGAGRIAKCLKEHEADLSRACKRQMEEVKKRVYEFREVCEDDVLRLCGGVKHGGGRIIKCLKEHESELSPECKAKMETQKGHHK
jgi:Cysteine rich repeat